MLPDHLGYGQRIDSDSDWVIKIELGPNDNNVFTYIITSLSVVIFMNSFVKTSKGSQMVGTLDW